MSNLAQENADLRARLIAVLESCRCQHHYHPDQGWLEAITIGECIKRGECGCDAGDLIKISQRIAS